MLCILAIFQQSRHASDLSLTMATHLARSGGSIGAESLAVHV